MPIVLVLYNSRVIYDEPFTIAEDPGNFVKKVVATIDLKEEDLGRPLAAFKVSIISEEEGALMQDFYWEGVSILKAAGGFERIPAPKIQCSIF